MVKLRIKILSIFNQDVNLKVDKINNDNTTEEVFMDPVAIGDEVILEDVPLKE